MSRYINDFPEEIILQVLMGYLYDGKSHRGIQREILNLPAPANGGGFIAMSILHHFGIKGDRKAVLSHHDIDKEISANTGMYRQALRAIKEYKETEKKVRESLMINEFSVDTSNTEIMGKTKIRISQNVLRDYVLNNYGNQCALCGINIRDLLVCSHIKPWAVSEENRLNPANAICLCVLHDRLFDRGYFSLNDRYQIIFSCKACESVRLLFTGLCFRKPVRDMPGTDFLHYHYQEICSK